MANEIAAESNATVIGVEANVLDKASLEKARQIINEKLGEIDILINGAGGNHPTATTKVEQMDEASIDHLEETFYGLEMDGFDKVFALNFKGTLLPTMVFTQDMLKNRKGVVLNISSMNSYKPLTKIPHTRQPKRSQ
jgi:NAD(P)-dependent dehydrogenase (short-subunit alcohol dehydrogenase family)